MAADPAELLGLKAADIRQRMFTRQEDLPEGVTRLALKTIHVNKSPIVLGKLPSSEVTERWGLDRTQGLRHAELLAKRAAAGWLWSEVFEREPLPPLDVDEDLYGGFVGNEDRRACSAVRALSPQELADRAAEGKLAFQDERLDEIVFRYRARNFPGIALKRRAGALVGALRGTLCTTASAVPQTLTAYMDKLTNWARPPTTAGGNPRGFLADYAEQIAPEV